MARALIHLLLLTLALACPLGAWAAEAEEAAATEPADQEKSRTSEQNPDPEGNSEVFIPTEEISEDFAVSFPVDI